MNKIGICCEYNHRNYGSMLQSYATVKKIEDLGYDYEIIRYSKKLTPGLFLKSISRIPYELKKRYKKKRQRMEIRKHSDIAKSMAERNKMFDAFQEECFSKFSKVCDDFGELRELSKGYDAVLVGSDQLWNPVGYSTGFFNLLFVDDKTPKIAYATSFGISDIPADKKGIAKKFLSRMEHISVRELRGSEIVKELIGRDVPTVVDPTILYNGEEWKEMIPEKRIVDEKYMLCYFLGTNAEHREKAMEVQKRLGCKIVFLPHLDEFIEGDLNFGDIRLYNVSPSEFVNLIRHAEFVCTDSFHGSVFSILNHKRFLTFNRFDANSSNSRNSRIDSLLKLTGLEKRRYQGEINDSCFDIIDYAEVEDKLSDLRAMSLDYLKNALEDSQRKRNEV